MGSVRNQDRHVKRQVATGRTPLWTEPLTGHLESALHVPDDARDLHMAIPSDRPLHVGLISDTHLSEHGRSVPQGARELLDGSDYILHAGDVACQRVLDELGDIAPVFAVAGNVDPPQLRRTVPEWLTLRIGSWRIVLVHDAGERVGGRGHRATARYGSLHVLIFGHSHEPGVTTESGVLLVNPGSAVQRRRAPRHTVGRLDISNMLTAMILPFTPA